MVRLALRAFLHPASIVLLDLIILVPVVLSIGVVLSAVWQGQIEEPTDVLEGVGVVLIGWGVAIEERPSLRVIFSLTTTADPALEAGIDLLCHSSGIGLLILGLFSEIAVAAVRLPNHIVPTEGIDHWVLYVSTAFVVLAAFVLTQHIVRLAIAMIWRRVPAVDRPAVGEV
jgi:hypothetical protein